MKAVIRSRWFIAASAQPWELDLGDGEHVVGATTGPDSRLIWIFTSKEVAS